MHWGQGPGLSLYDLGEVAGVETVTLLSTQMPAHTHTAQITVGCNADDATLGNPAGAVLAIPNASTGAVNAYTPSSAGTSGTIAGVNATINAAGNSQPHENHQPYLVVTFIVALFGVFPSRN
jgi:microcystin-dependent protein